MQLLMLGELIYTAETTDCVKVKESIVNFLLLLLVVGKLRVLALSFFCADAALDPELFLDDTELQ